MPVSATHDSRGTELVPVISIDGLYQRFRLLIHESFKFLVVGGIGVVITIGAAIALHGLGKYVAITIATIAATIFTFLGNRYWTFRHRQGQGATQEGVMFFLLNGVGLLIYYGCIWAIQDLMGLESKLWYTGALIIGTGLGTAFRFWSYRKWVWQMQHNPRPVAPELIGYAEPAMAAVAPPRAIRFGSIAAARPPGQSAARHAGQRRAPSRPSLARGRAGAHRRT